jgi:flagellin-like hook-associated protein FlgL
MATIALSAGVRQALSSLQSTASEQTVIQNRLATGKKVNSALDNPSSFFTASGLSNRASDLGRLLDDMGQAVKTVEAADKGLKGITKLVENAQSLAKQALSTSDATVRASLATDFADVMTQIDEMAADSGYNGKNLLDSDTLTVLFNEDGTSDFDIAGVDSSSTGLGIAAAANSWAADADIDAAVDDLTAAVTTLRSNAASFGTSLSIVQNRQDFTKGMIDTLNNGADQLTIADPNEEGAKLLALNTRAQLSSTALSLASQADQAVMRLF